MSGQTGDGASSADRGVLRAFTERILTLFRGSDSSSTLVRGASWSVVVIAAGLGLGFATQTVLTRTLGGDGYGVYSYALGLINMVVMLTTLDFGTSAVRFVGVYEGGRDWGRLKAFLSEIRLVVIGLTTLVGIATAVYLLMHRAQYEPGLFVAYLIACALLPVTAMLAFLETVLQGLKRVVLAQSPNLIVRPIVFLALLLGWGLFAVRNFTPAVALGANLSAAIVALFFANWGVARSLPPEVRTAHGKSDLALWVRTALGLFAVSASQVVLAGQIDVVVVGTFLSTASAGLYNLALLLSRATHIGLEAVLYVTMPMIAEFYANRSKDELQRLLSNAVRLGAAVSVPLIVGMALGGRFILGFFFGSEFEAAYPILLITLLNSLQSAFAGGICGFVMSMTGHQTEASWRVGISALVYLALVVPLTKIYGAPGTALATLIAFSVRTILLTWFIRTRLGLNVLPVPWPFRRWG